MTITSKHVDPQGSVHLWDLGPTKVKMAAVDARHAIETDPQRWVPVDPDSPDKYEPAERSASEFGGESAGSSFAAGGVFGEDGRITQYHPDPTDARSESEKGSG